MTRLTPRMVRVTFGGVELTGFGWNGPAAHIKLIFGEPPVDDAAPRPPMRTYTPKRFDRETGELDVDFVLHGVGPASSWAEQARVGQSLVIAGPGRHYVVDPGADWFLLAGDDTALPAICTILESLPAQARAIVLAEVVDAAEEHTLEVGATQPSITWLHRGPDVSRAGMELERAIRQLELPRGSGRAYVACESDAMRRIRRHLLTERNLERAHLVTRGYWKLGATDHPDRDYGEDQSLATKPAFSPAVKPACS